MSYSFRTYSCFWFMPPCRRVAHGEGRLEVDVPFITMTLRTLSRVAVCGADSGSHCGGGAYIGGSDGVGDDAEAEGIGTHVGVCREAATGLWSGK